MIIYKYLDEEGTIKTIERNSVLLKTPLEFNDPFDSIFYVSDDEMVKAFKLFMNYQFFKQTYDGLFDDKNKPTTLGRITKKNMEYDVARIKKSKTYRFLSYLNVSYSLGKIAFKKNDKGIEHEFKNKMNPIFDTLRDLSLVGCFSKVFDSILMWSHYSNKHKGACIEFEINDNDKDFKKVNYSKELKEFNFYKALEIIFGHQFLGEEPDTNKPEYQFLIEPMLVKSEEWVYEEEVRCIYSKNQLDSKIYEIEEDGKKKMLLKMPKIKRIFLGCKADKDFIKDVREAAKDIPIFQMSMLKDEYGLEIKQD